MDDIRYCGNIVPKFPGGPQQVGTLTNGIVAAGLVPSLTGGLKLDPEPDPWNVQGGFAR